MKKKKKKEKERIRKKEKVKRYEQSGERFVTANISFRLKSY